jgi:hypothetical protein
LAVRQAIQFDNYHRFFSLYKDTPNLGNYILDLMLDGRRLQALQRICRGYKPSVPLDFVISALSFDNIEEGVEFVKKAGCMLIRGGGGEEVSGKGDSNSTEGAIASSDEIGAGGVIDGVEINTKDSLVSATAVFTQDKLLM